MEFNVTVDLGHADLQRIDHALRDVDPAAVVDTGGDALRVAGAFDIVTLLTTLRDAGCELTAHDIQRLPSVCCGGCSG